jgi:hypothetical protein
MEGSASDWKKGEKEEGGGHGSDMGTWGVWVRQLQEGQLSSYQKNKSSQPHVKVTMRTEDRLGSQAVRVFGFTTARGSEALNLTRVHTRQSLSIPLERPNQTKNSAQLFSHMQKTITNRWYCR